MGEPEAPQDGWTFRRYVDGQMDEDDYFDLAQQAAKDALMAQCQLCGGLIHVGDFSCEGCGYKPMPDLMQTDSLETAVYEYLDALRDSGKANMYGARPYLEQAFGFSKADANDWLWQWMETFADRHGLEGE